MTDAPGRALAMPQRRCGRTGLYTSALALAFDMTDGGGGSLGTVRALMHHALEWNINHIDLASSEATTRDAVESLLGCLFEQELKGHRDDLIITANVGQRVWRGPYGAGGGRKHILASLDQTLARLGLEYVDVLCAGPFDDGTPLDETMGAIHHAIREGKARYAGVSSYTSIQTCEAIQLLDRLGVRLAVHHSIATIFATDPELALTDVLESNGVGAIRHFRRPAGVRPRSHREVVLRHLAQDRGQTPTQVAVAWSLQQPSLASVSLPAARSEHVTECATALQQLSFTTGERTLLGDLL
jgi:L-glyceraldehyde 3-phosphate reductase